MASDRSRYISVNLLPHHKKKLEHLVKVSGTNRNAFLRAVIMGLTDDDVERLLQP